jgi:hypothetical protein
MTLILESLDRFLSWWRGHEVDSSIVRSEEMYVVWSWDTLVSTSSIFSPYFWTGKKRKEKRCGDEAPYLGYRIADRFRVMMWCGEVL